MFAERAAIPQCLLARHHEDLSVTVRSWKVLRVPGWRNLCAAELLSQAVLYLLLLHQTSVMWHDFTLREVERHLQGDQDGELKRYQLLPADPETLL